MILLIDVNFGWNQQYTQSVLPILLTLVFFVTYWFISISPKIKSLFFDRFNFDDACMKYVFFTKIVGFFFMGLIPFASCLLLFKKTNLSDYGLTIIPETTIFSIIWIFILSFIVVPMAYYSARKPQNLINYPQIKAKRWTRKIFYINLLGWFLYLFGYELLFRGILLFPLIKSVGIWPAIAVNIALYSATHIPKGLSETLGAIPLGLVLCILTLYSGTIWIAFLVHVALAWTNSLSALKHHPEIYYIHWKEKK